MKDLFRSHALEPITAGGFNVTHHGDGDWDDKTVAYDADDRWWVREQQLSHATHPRNQEAPVADTEDPIISEEERAEGLAYIREQVNATFDDFADDGRVAASDAVESIFDLALKWAGFLVSPQIGAVIALIGPSIKSALVGAVAKADAKARTAEALARRVADKRAKAKTHEDTATRLAETEKREFFEKLRIRWHRDRARDLLRDALDLEGLIANAAA